MSFFPWLHVHTKRAEILYIQNPWNSTWYMACALSFMELWVSERNTWSLLASYAFCWPCFSKGKKERVIWNWGAGGNHFNRRVHLEGKRQYVDFLKQSVSVYPLDSLSIPCLDTAGPGKSAVASGAQVPLWSPLLSSILSVEVRMICFALSSLLASYVSQG